MTSAINYNKSRPYTSGLWKEVQATIGAAADGIPGQETAEKIAQWQSVHGLTADGMCGPRTLIPMGHSMYSYIDPATGSNTGAVQWASTHSSVCADGDPVAYHPDNIGADYLANAGKPGNWWGLSCDSTGKPFIQGPDHPAPGYYVSTTAMNRTGYYKQDPRRFVYARAIPYVVRPRNAGDLFPVVPSHGDLCRVTVGELATWAIYAEVGPELKLGTNTQRAELSIAALEAIDHFPWRYRSEIWRADLSSSNAIQIEAWPGTSHLTEIVDVGNSQRLVVALDIGADPLAP